MSQPLVSASRLVGLDVARCLALVGMIATHALVSSTPDGGATTVHAIASGRSSALFALLAGVSMSLMSGRSTPLTGRALRAARTGLVVRAGFIGGLGLVLGSLQTTIAVILTYYAVLFCLGLPFLRLRALPLAVTALAWAVAAPVVSHVVRPLLPERDYASPSVGSLGRPLQLLSELLMTGYYPAFVWLAYLLAGMALGRLDLRSARTGAVLVTAGSATAVLSWSVSGWLLARDGVTATLQRTFAGPGQPGGLADTLEHGTYGTTPTGSWWWLAVHAPHSGTPFDLLHTGGSAVTVVGACLLVARLAPAVFAVAFGAGTMTLTLYSLHVFLRIPELWPEDNVETFSRHVLLVLAIGVTYRLARRRGPLEQAVGSLANAARDAVAGPSAADPPPPASAAASGDGRLEH